ncbi:hydroxymethylglutaryl-CoA lyase [Asinibacterium sp. OR53]|uniref:hydroxymethylglutaryl-CoA lyase n=1 Tax=Asinibacterium sp. OR53 TaxID=925409 RepID=UPI0004145142|nr:hydroxymethylglutaryl-CoA lyase [Asinibacterium sp. OR53]
MNADTLLPALQLIECPRDAMQGWPHLIATADKVRYLNALLQVGFDTLDFGSFVSPKAIPQMADTREVLKGLDLGSTSTKLLAIVANERGAEEAVVYDTVHYLGFPFSISPTFQLRNTNSTIEESEKRVDAIQELCLKTGKELVIYLSMGFGNPYNDPYNEDILLQWADAMAEKDIRIISLADTVGLATPSQISKALITLIPQHPDITIGVHLHSTAQNWEAKLTAALDAGCLRFDGALKGIGGCPMAQDELIGNMDTLLMIPYFQKRNLSLDLDEIALKMSTHLATTLFVQP